MTPLEFLKAVWPDEGLYCIAIPSDEGKGYKHFVRDTIGKAVHVVERFENRNLFFCIHTLKEEKLWNPQKRNNATGEMGAWEKRTQRNSKAARVFFFDLDVEADNPKKYGSQRDALAGLIDFCSKAHLPKPLVTSSGGGLHVYFLLTDALDAETWRTHAVKLRALAKHHGLRFDPMRTIDTASVLRVVGTFNHKNGQKRPVKVYVPGERTPTGEFLKRLEDAVIRSGVSVKETPRVAATAIHNPFEDNVSQNVSGFPPPSLEAVLKACKQMQEIIRTRGAVDEPVWYNTLNILRFVENGRSICHRWSEGYPGYDYDATERKIDQLESVVFEGGKKLGPTLCAKLAEAVGDDRLCEGCPAACKNTSPVHASRLCDEAPPPVIEVKGLDDVVTTFTLPPPPKPFKRLKTGIGMEFLGGDGEITTQIIYDHDLYPLRRIVNKELGIEQLMWRVVLPREGERDFSVDAEALYDNQKFCRTLSNTGVYPDHSNINHMQAYMTSYIKELQRLADADKQMNYLGWGEDMKSFILPDRVVETGGASKPVSLGKAAARAAQDLYKKGELQEQVKLLKFYNDKRYAAHQLYILGSLAAPMYHATGQHGMIVNITGPTGASKSSAQSAAASMWGHPDTLPINGTRKGATENMRLERMATFSNIPVFIDEITHFSKEEAEAMSMGVSQANGGKGRLERDGSEREKPRRHKATLLLTTSNRSLHGMLAVDNAAGSAGSMRVFEMNVTDPGVHQKWDADDFRRDLARNFGHIGEVFIADLLSEGDYEQRVRDVMREVDQRAGVIGGERFWSSYIAPAIVACERANRLGLLDWDAKFLLEYAITVQLAAQRNIVKQEYSTPAGILANYLDSINANILITTRSEGAQNKEFVNIVRAPINQRLLAHYDMTGGFMYVGKQGWKEYCARIGANPVDTLKELYELRDARNERLITSVHHHKTLGAGTDFAKMQSWCFVINMHHELTTQLRDTLEGVTKKPSGEQSLQTMH